MVSFDEPVENAWMRSHGRCECRRASHGHVGRCDRDLLWEHRGRPAREDAWEAHHNHPAMAAGWEAARQCTILCWACYKETTRAASASQDAKRKGRSAERNAQDGLGAGALSAR